MAFNWQELDDDRFLKWLLISFITKSPSEDDLSEKLREATDGFTNVELAMQVNGVEVPAEGFIYELRRHMDHLANKAAVELADKATADLHLDGVRDLLGRAEEAIRREVTERLTDAGIRFPLEKENDW